MDISFCRFSFEIKYVLDWVIPRSEISSFLISSSEDYAAELDQQIESLEKRAAESDAETRARLNKLKGELQAERQVLKKELADDYEAAVFGLENEIERLKQEAEDTSEESRASVIEAIEHLEGRLELAKKRLSER